MPKSKSIVVDNGASGADASRPRLSPARQRPEKESGRNPVGGGNPCGCPLEASGSGRSLAATYSDRSQSPQRLQPDTERLLSVKGGLFGAFQSWFSAWSRSASGG